MSVISVKRHPDCLLPSLTSYCSIMTDRHRTLAEIVAAWHHLLNVEAMHALEPLHFGC